MAAPCRLRWSSPDRWGWPSVARIWLSARVGANEALGFLQGRHKLLGDEAVKAAIHSVVISGEIKPASAIAEVGNGRGARERTASCIRRDSPDPEYRVPRGRSIEIRNPGRCRATSGRVTVVVPAPAAARAMPSG